MRLAIFDTFSQLIIMVCARGSIATREKEEIEMKVPHFRRNYVRQKLSEVGRPLAVIGATLGMVALPLGPAVQAESTSKLQADFAQASQEFGVPENVLLAVSYNQTRWENHDGKVSAQGGYGVMHLTTSVEAQDGRGDGKTRKVQITANSTLDEASGDLKTDAQTLKKDDAQNIRGAASILATDAKQLNNGQLPSSVDGWYAAVAKYSGATTTEDAQDFADDVYNTMQKGASRKTDDGQQVTLRPSNVSSRHGDMGRLHLRHRVQSQDGVECPIGLNCRFVPAAYASDDANDKTNYGNYDSANRPKDMKINQIVIHDTEGSYDSAISEFQSPTAYVSAHYVIRSSDGAITQMVPTKDVAWHAGNWYTNMHSIGIEHEGFAAAGATWYTEAMYNSSAKLVRYLADKYHIPLDRQHIIGHEEVPAPLPGNVAGMHTDPGPFFDWRHYMDLLHSPIASQDKSGGNAVTFNQNFANNQPILTDCSTNPCTNLPSQGSSVTYLHTQPDVNSAILSDPVTGGATNAISDMSDKASAGQTFIKADQQGDWTAIWFNGQKAWFYNPSSNKAATTTWALKIKPKVGMSSIPVYGRAYPEASAYPSTITPQSITPLQYTIASDQRYPVVGYAPTDYFYASTVDLSAPDDHTVVQGHDRYIPISYNHRQAFVKLSDVDFDWSH